MLLGSGELGKELVIAAKRAGLYVVACDRYDNAPAMQVAHRCHVLNMLDGAKLREIIELERPDHIIPEVEAIATPTLVELEKEGYHVTPTATAALLTMNREGIRRLAAEELPITLSISLHAPDDETRSAIMPVNRRYPIAELMEACRYYYGTTGRRISFEYTLIKGKNSSPADAYRLAGLLNRSLRREGENMPIHVNLIPVNPVRETGLMPPDRAEISAFASRLEEKGIRATVRRRLGPDIDAACGQLRRASMQKSAEDGGNVT